MIKFGEDTLEDGVASLELIAGRYRLLGNLGEGGMAVVHRAEDTRFGRTVAVKILRDTYAADASFLSLFEQEARAAAGLAHPNIATVFDSGSDAGKHFMVLEYVPGQDLKTLIQQRSPLPVSEAVGYAQQLLSGLGAAHAAGMVHRDIKPQNLLITPEGKLKILDFGIARALGGASFTRPGEVLGSVHYLSPEQARGEKASPASDIYSAGVVLYEMLTGRRPFEGENVTGVLYQQVHEVPPSPHEFNPRIPKGLEAVVLQALAKTPERRFFDAQAMAAALRNFTTNAEDRTGAIALPAAPGIGSPTRMLPAPAPERKGFDGLLFFLIAASVGCLALIALVAFAAYREYTSASAQPETSATPAAVILPSPTAQAQQATPVAPPATTIVPKVEGLTAADARKQIEGARLVYQATEEQSKEVAAGLVIRQSPVAGASVPPGQPVNVVVSKAPSQVAVPQVTGLTFTEAENRLKVANLAATRQDEFNKDVAAGNVIAQEPKPGAMLDLGSQVKLTVSQGPEPAKRFVVPEVVGLKEADAKALITQAGLTNAPYVNLQGKDQLPDGKRNVVCVGCVLSSSPAPGTQLSAGAVVSLAVRKE